MKNVNTKTTKEVKTPNTKENKNMKKSTSKKEVAVVTENTNEVVKNETKTDELLDIRQVTELYFKHNIKCYNPQVRGNYRIMGNSKGSSLNLKKNKGYFIYSTQIDFDNIKNANLECSDLVIEEKTNSQDHARPHTIICKTVETLEKVLNIYSQNTLNQNIEQA